MKPIGLFKIAVLSLLAVAVGASAAPEHLTFVSKTYDVTHARGLVRTREGREFLRTAPRQSFTDVSVPAKYSLRGLTGPIEDQGYCGSCWDFSLTSTLRGTFAAAGQDPGRLSFNYLLNCAKEQYGCQGGDFPAADHFVTPQGAPAYGADGEYTATEGACQSTTPVASVVSYKFLGPDLGLFPDHPYASFRDIAYVVGVLHQPVSVDVNADYMWESYSSGVYNACSDEDPKDSNHMVVVEGYDCETAVDSAGNCAFDANGNLPAGVGTWLVRNSWGASWGDQGYITTKATDSEGHQCNGLGLDALYYDIGNN
jgi:C1A family cysteine protease